MNKLEVLRAETAEEWRDVHKVACKAFSPEVASWASLAARLASSRRQGAEAWLLTVDGAAASSLLSYPLEVVGPRGEVWTGFGLGSVGTYPDFRRQGLAAQLCRAVAQDSFARGRHLGLLYSGIGAGYYEGLGYRKLPAWNLRTERLEELAKSGPSLPWTPIDPRLQLGQLKSLRDDHLQGRTHMRREEAGWRLSMDERDDELWLGLKDSSAGLRGYVRAFHDEHQLYLGELTVTNPAELLPALRGLAELALEAQAKVMRGWLDPKPELAEWFEDLGREETLPMMLGEVEAGDWSLSTAEYF